MTAPRIKLKTGDTVQMLTGADRGKKGKVMQMLPAEGLVVIEGINQRTKNVRSRQRNQSGEQIKYNAPVKIANCLLVCPQCHKTTRISILRNTGKRLRQCTQCHQTIE